MSDTMSTLHRVLTALAVLGEASPADIASKAGLGYSTVPPKLRNLQADDLAIRTSDGSGKTLWKLTPKGVLAAAVTPGVAPAELLAADGTVPERPGTQAPDPADEPGAHAPSPGGDDEQSQDGPATAETAETAATGTSPQVGPIDEPGVERTAGPAAEQAEPAAGDAAVDTIGSEPDDQQVAGDDDGPDAADESPEPDGDETGTAPVEPSAGVVTAVSGADHGVQDPAEITATAAAFADEPLVDDPAAVIGDEEATPASRSDAGEGSAAPPTTDGEAIGGDATDGEATDRVKARPAGGLRAEVLQILRDNPGQTFKVSQMCKAIDAVRTGPMKQLGGSVANALAKLANLGEARIVAEKPATYQAS
jgi:hypothetical protein